MENVKLEEKMFSDLIKNNFDKISKLWTPSTPFSHPMLSPDSVLEKLPTERNKIMDEYKDTKILYTIDKNGYRKYPGLNQDSKKRIACFGCSYTFGFGVPDDHTWPYQLAKLLGEDYYADNYGVVGSSVGFACRKFYQTINLLKKEEYPEAVFFLFPDPFRFYHIGNENESLILRHNNLSLYTHKYIESFNPKTDRKFLINKYLHDSFVDSFFKFVKNLNMIKEIAENRNIPWYWYTWSVGYYKAEKNVLNKYVDTHNTLTDDFGLIPMKFFGYSRDGSHWNGKTNELISNGFYKLYKR